MLIRTPGIGLGLSRGLTILPMPMSILSPGMNTDFAYYIRVEDAGQLERNLVEQADETARHLVENAGEISRNINQDAGSLHQNLVEDAKDVVRITSNDADEIFTGEGRNE
jgi:hypothetical protein